jgi:mRNA-degrading endonuclease RelE of RelBE toxin-antitoxin system
VADTYDVKLTKTAEATYSKVYEEANECLKAGDATNSKVTLLRQLDDVIDKIIPHDPFNPKRALSGSLSNIFRIPKGRIRICYVGSSKKKQIVILYISETLRKAGDARDPYAIFTQMVLSGRYDEIFEDLGIRRPPRNTANLAQPIIQ